MITKEFRPSKFSEVSGQELPKELLKSIVKKPEQAPKSIILEGGYGLGKTSLSRIFAKALNCKHLSKDGDVCGECDTCRSNIEETIYYDEYDSAMIGNVADIKELTDSLYFDKSLGYKVLCLDEAQLISIQAQASLLKVIEESNQSIFFLFCTTNIEKVLPTIQSRSLILPFTPIPMESMRLNLESILLKKNTSISNELLNSIMERSKGHLRNAHILLDELLLLGEDRFKELVKSAKELYSKLLIASIRNDNNSITKIIELLSSFPLETLKSDYELFVLDIIKVGLGVYKTEDKYLAFIVTLYKEKIFNLIDILNSTEIYDMFSSDKRFQAAMYIISKKVILQK